MSRKVPPGERKSIAALYRRGYTLGQITQRMERAMGTIVRVLWEADVKYRKHSWAVSRLPEAVRNEVVHLYRKGRTLREAMRAAHVPLSTVRRILLLAHVPLRPQGYPPRRQEATSCQ